MDCCITIKTSTQYSSVLPVYQNYESHTIALSQVASCLSPYGGGIFSHSLKPTVVRLNCSHRPFPLSDVCSVTYAKLSGREESNPIPPVSYHRPVSSRFHWGLSREGTHLREVYHSRLLKLSQRSLEVLPSLFI